jgi:hypothetical protein
MLNELPKRVRLISGSYYWRPSKHLRAKGINAMPLGADREKAIAAATRLNDSTDAYLRRDEAAHRVEIAAAYRRAFTRARKRAAEHGRAFDLTEPDLATAIERADGHCEVSGIEFDLSPQDNRRRLPFAPSIDRIDAKAGYAAGNVRLVCVCVNIMVSDFGDEVFLRVCREAMRHTKRALGGKIARPKSQPMAKMATPAGLEPATYRLEGK